MFDDGNMAQLADVGFKKASGNVVINPNIPYDLASFDAYYLRASGAEGSKHQPQWAALRTEGGFPAPAADVKARFAPAVDYKQAAKLFPRNPDVARFEGGRVGDRTERRTRLMPLRQSDQGTQTMLRCDCGPEFNLRYHEQGDGGGRMNRRMLRCGTVVVLGILAFACPAWADDESDRRDLISKIDGKLDYAASKLSGLESRSDASELNDALSNVREAESVVSELSNKKGSDSRANEIVSKYPDYIRSFRDAAGYAIRLKQGQRLADAGADQCKADEADLQTLIRNYVNNSDESQEALSKLPEKGRQYGSKWTEKLSTWERHHREMASNASYARFSVSDGNWSRVSSNFSSSVSQISSHWMKK